MPSRKQQVAVDGQRVHTERNVYYAVHKPKGYVSTNHDPAGKPRVVDILPEIPERVYTVGRLDEQSTGLMILTNDGYLANRLAHPKFGVEKLYRVVVAGTPDRSVLTQLTDGIWLAEGKVRAKRVRIVGSKGMATVLEMTLAEGLYLEATLFGVCCATEDKKEGTTAFLEKRAAAFKGK